MTCTVTSTDDEIRFHLMYRLPFECNMCNSIIKIITKYNNGSTTVDVEHSKRWREIRLIYDELLRHEIMKL
jgi:hypothetical protein